MWVDDVYFSLWDDFVMLVLLWGIGRCDGVVGVGF